MAGDNRLQPVGRRWTTSCTPCGSFLRPQSVESLHPRIHRGLTWSDGLSTVTPVDTIGTTSRSPGCGRQKVTESVESGRNPARIRTADVVPVAVKRGPTASEQAPEALGAPLGPGLRSSRGPSERGPEPSGILPERVPEALGRLPESLAARVREPRARTAGQNRGPQLRAGTAGQNNERRPRDRVPGAPSAAYRRACQPFLMRLVSSVTWL
jgi:hypothetical protein